MEYEAMDVDARTAAARAASQYLLAHGYVSLEEACIARDVTMEELWRGILADAGLPPCDVPAFAMIM